MQGWYCMCFGSAWCNAIIRNNLPMNWITTVVYCTIGEESPFVLVPLDYARRGFERSWDVVLKEVETWFWKKSRRGLQNTDVGSSQNNTTVSKHRGDGSISKARCRFLVEVCIDAMPQSASSSCKDEMTIKFPKYEPWGPERLFNLFGKNVLASFCYQKRGCVGNGNLERQTSFSFRFSVQ